MSCVIITWHNSQCSMLPTNNLKQIHYLTEMCQNLGLIKIVPKVYKMGALFCLNKLSHNYYKNLERGMYIT